MGESLRHYARAYVNSQSEAWVALWLGSSRVSHLTQERGNLVPMVLFLIWGQILRANFLHTAIALCVTASGAGGACYELHELCL